MVTIDEKPPADKSYLELFEAGRLNLFYERNLGQLSRSFSSTGRIECEDRKLKKRKKS